jgi:transposase
MTTKSNKPQDKPGQLRASGTLNRKPERVTDPLFSEQAFFDPRDLVQIKYEMLRRVLHDGHSVAAAAAAFGFSRPAFYKAKQALQACGLAGLVPLRTGPRGAHKLNDEVMAFVMAAKTHDARLTSQNLVERIAAQFNLTVHARSVERALARKKKQGSKGNKGHDADET